MLYIFPTSRAIRSFHSLYDENSLLPKALSIADFEAKVTYVPNKIRADNDTRVLLLKQACSLEVFDSLHIPREFLAFLNSSTYLFGFFEELSYEGKNIQDLRHCDIYGEFEQHLDILEVLYQNYIKLLDDNSLYDSITLPKLYKINEDFLQDHEEITFVIEGFLNGFEWELLEKLIPFVHLFLQLQISPYNQKICLKLQNMGIDLPQSGTVLIDLNEKTYTLQSLPQNKPSIYAKSFSLRSLQIGYIFWQIQEMVGYGIEPEKIAVILPDEKFATLLQSFDKQNNLNFAMGFSLNRSKIVQKLKTISGYIQHKSLDTTYAICRFALQESVSIWQERWDKSIDFIAFKSMVTELLEDTSETVRKVEEELYSLEKLYQQVPLKLHEIVRLLINRLATSSTDDVRGGKVTVLGLLETRGVTYEGVIIVDFNDKYIPKSSQKDMFLSTSLRAYANLPTKYDRENLQRYYYHQIISKAKRVALTSVKNEEHLPSRFLYELDFKDDDRYDESSYAPFLLQPNESKTLFCKEDIVLPNTFFTYPLSSSRLKAYLTCPRCYYFAYILGIKDEEIPSDELSARDVGIMLHDALLQLYETNSSFQDEKELYHHLSYFLDKQKTDATLWTLEKELWKKRLQAFCANEIQRARQGWKPWKLEHEIKLKYKDIQIVGKIDRIDINQNDQIEILDYKSGKIIPTNPKKIDETVDFQMQFYALLGDSLGKEIKGVGFYDLMSGTIIYEEYMDEKLEQLSKIIEELKGCKNLHFNVDEKKCKFTAYPILCGKEDL